MEGMETKKLIRGLTFAFLEARAKQLHALIKSLRAVCTKLCMVPKWLNLNQWPSLLELTVESHV